MWFKDTNFYITNSALVPPGTGKCNNTLSDGLCTCLPPRSSPKGQFTKAGGCLDSSLSKGWQSGKEGGVSLRFRWYLLKAPHFVSYAALYCVVLVCVERGSPQKQHTLEHQGPSHEEVLRNKFRLLYSGVLKVVEEKGLEMHST